MHAVAEGQDACKLWTWPSCCGCTSSPYRCYWGEGSSHYLSRGVYDVCRCALVPDAHAYPGGASTAGEEVGGSRMGLSAADPAVEGQHWGPVHEGVHDADMACLCGP